MSRGGVLRVAICDTWMDYSPTGDAILNAILPGGLASAEHADVASADLVYYSIWGLDHLRAAGTSVAFSMEPSIPERSSHHWSIDWRHLNQPNHLRLPVWAWIQLGEPLAFNADGTDPAERRFCNFIYSRDVCPLRNAFFEALHRRQPVDALGAIHNNMSNPALSGRIEASWRESKVAVLGDYRFTIAFENSEHVGYTTEKLIDAWLADTVPIYWGNPALGADLPVGACLSLYEAGSMDKLVDQVLEVHHDPERYEAIRQANPFRTGEIHKLLDRFTGELADFGARVHADALHHAGTKRVSALRRLDRRLSLLRPLPRKVLARLER